MPSPFKPGGHLQQCWNCFPPPVGPERCPPGIRTWLAKPRAPTEGHTAWRLVGATCAPSQFFRRLFSMANPAAETQVLLLQQVRRCRSPPNRAVVTDRRRCVQRPLPRPGASLIVQLAGGRTVQDGAPVRAAAALAGRAAAGHVSGFRPRRAVRDLLATQREASHGGRRYLPHWTAGVSSWQCGFKLDRGHMLIL